MPFAGGTTPVQIGSKRSDTSVASAVSFWVKQDGCSPSPQHSETSEVHTDIYSGCKDGTGVALYAIQGGHHMWPGVGISGSCTGDGFDLGVLRGESEGLETVSA